MKTSKRRVLLITVGVGTSLFATSHNIFAAANNPLTLETSMNMAEDYAFSARIAEYSVESSQGKADEQLRSMLPNISLSGNYLKYDNHVNKAVGTTVGAELGLPDTTASTAALTLTQPLVGLIPLFLSLQAASAQAEAALHSRNQTRADARFLGANSFINAVKAIQLLNVADSSVQVAQTQLHDGVAQYNAGKLTNADVLKFKLNLENSKTNLIQAQTTAKITFLTLAETTGIKDLSLITLPKENTSALEKKKLPLKNLGGYISEALSSRSDLLAAKSMLQGAKYSKYATESSYLPSVNFVSSYSRNFKTDAIDIPATQVSPAINYSKSDIQDMFYYGIQLNWNLLDWGVRQAQISEAVANESSANIQQEQIESQIKIDVTNNFLRLKDAYQTLDSAKVSVEYAKDVFLQMEAQFNNGQATTTDVLAASNDQTSAMAKLANAVGDLDIAWLSLQKSVGDRLTTLDK
ncbi:MAG: TolC family protein [Bdellovibrionota bacterium]